MKEYKIYCLKDPNTDKIRYIGVTTSKYLSSRLSQHYYCAKHNYQTYVAKWIRSLNKKPIIELIEICYKNNWEDREKYWINYYDNLTNTHIGGKGVVINRDNSSIERSAKAHEIKIVQLNDNGELIKIWSSLKEACEFFKGKSLSSISNVLKNRSNRAFKYQWFYYDDYINNNFSIKKDKSKVNYNNIEKVFLYDINKNFIKEYKSLYSLSNDLSCAYTSARRALKNNKLLYKKYIIQNYKI